MPERAHHLREWWRPGAGIIWAILIVITTAIAVIQPATAQRAPAVTECQLDPVAPKTIHCGPEPSYAPSAPAEPSPPAAGRTFTISPEELRGWAQQQPAAAPVPEPTGRQFTIAPEVVIAAFVVLIALAAFIAIIRYAISKARENAAWPKIWMAVAFVAVGAFFLASGLQQGWGSENWFGQRCNSRTMCVHPEWFAIGAALLAIAYLMFKRRGRGMGKAQE